MILYTNAEFISCEPENRIFHVMGVEKGRIVYTGDKEPENLKSTIKKVDLQGACVTPAFADSHMHFESLCIFENTFYLMDAEDFSQAKSIVEAYGRKNPKRKILLGYGVSAHTLKEKRLPERKDLDLWTERPLIIVKYDGHAAVCNSSMMSLLSESVLKDPGCDRESGWLYQNAFYNGVNEATAFVPTMDIVRGLSKGADYLASKGIGMVHNVEGVGFAGDLDVDLIRFLSPGLPQTYRTFFQTMDLNAVKKHHFTRVGGCFKLALDGCFGSEDAALTEPYTNDPSNYGILNYSQEEVNNFAIQANRAGYQITMHCIGDRAVEQCLRAYEAAYEDYPREDARHIMIHVCLASGDQLKRAKKIGLCMAVQAPFIHWKQEPDAYLQSILGEERTLRLNALRSMHEAGLVIADGSDGPCTRPDPLRGMYCAVNHGNPEERITPLQALRMVTWNAAYLSHDEENRGSLTEGKIADFTVLSGNPLKSLRIDQIQVKALYLAGKKYKTGKRGVLAVLCRALYRKLFRKALL